MQLQLDKIRGLTNPWYNVKCKPCQKCLSLHLLVTFLISYNVFSFSLSLSLWYKSHLLKLALKKVPLSDQWQLTVNFLPD